MKYLLPIIASLSLAACTADLNNSETGMTYDFEETGTLDRNENGMTPGTWYLRHGTDEGMFIRLSFDEDTTCIENGAEDECARSVFKDELPVTIRGMKAEDGHIAVAVMEINGEPAQIEN